MEKSFLIKRKSKNSPYIQGEISMYARRNLHIMGGYN